MKIWSGRIIKCYNCKLVNLIFWCLCSHSSYQISRFNVVDLEDFVVFSKVNSIQYHNVQTESSDSHHAMYRELSTNATVNVIALATDSKRKRIYYSDFQRRTISRVAYNGSQPNDIITGECCIQ